MESIGFKEWALVCEALGRGEQSVLIRKGGIAEGREGFSFKHREFFLFPTFFHEQVELVRGGAGLLPGRPADAAWGHAGTIEIRFFAKLEVAATITSWETAAALKQLHVLREDVVRERFAYDDAPGIHVAFVRVFRLCASWIFPDERRFAGCRSWVDLPDVPVSISLEPVLSDAQHAQRMAQFERACSGVL